MNRTILVVDHNQAVRSQVRCALSDEQCDVFEADDGVEAFRRLNDGLKPELIIASIEAAREEGVNLIRAIRQISAYRHTPILILDAEAGGGVRTDWKEAGGTCCILGPFENSELLEKIRLLMSLISAKEREDEFSFTKDKIYR